MARPCIVNRMARKRSDDSASCHTPAAADKAEATGTQTDKVAAPKAKRKAVKPSARRA
jgi:hypothetical protein